MSGPVVFIGYIFLIPCVLGIIFSAFILIGSVATSVASETALARSSRTNIATRRAVVKKLHTNDVPQVLIDELVAGKSDEVEAYLNTHDIDQARLSWIRYAQKTLPSESDGPPTGSIGGLAMLVGGSLALVIGIGSFVGGLLGWLLVMRKNVLQCNFCGAVISAS